MYRKDSVIEVSKEGSDINTSYRGNLIGTKLAYEVVGLLYNLAG